MKTGKVKFFNATKGFGFITSDDDQNDVFVHVSGLIDEVRDGDAVSFDTEDGRRGLKAVNVKLL